MEKKNFSKFYDASKNFDDRLFADEIIEYFCNAETSEEVSELVTNRRGEEYYNRKIIARPPPMMSAFGRQYGLTMTELKRLAENFPDTIGHAFELAADVVKEFFIENGLLGRYNSQFAIFAGKNITDMKDKTEHLNTNVNLHGFVEQIEKEGSPLVLTPSSAPAQFPVVAVIPEKAEVTVLSKPTVGAREAILPSLDTPVNAPSRGVMDLFDEINTLEKATRPIVSEGSDFYEEYPDLPAPEFEV